MKKLKKTLTIVILAGLMLVILGNSNVFANNADLLEKTEYTEEFKKWLELSDEEKENVIMPRPYEVENTSIKSSNPFNIARMLKASINRRYSLKDEIPSNLIIKNQMQTNSCWTFATLSSLETNLALSNKKNGVNLSKVYDFSERHMEYATSKTFLNNVENKSGYNRKVGTGGNSTMAQSYLTNGTGAVPESEMPFENNEDIIDISKIKNKTLSSQVYDTVDFPDYQKEKNEENKTEILNKIKKHIQNYGSIYAGLHGASSEVSAFNCYNDETGAKYCNNTYLHNADHAVSIIGWDDEYSIDNFPASARPTKKGAWIVRNSWGEKVEFELSKIKEEIFNAYKQDCIKLGWNSAEEIPNIFLEKSGFTVDGNKAFRAYGDNGIIYVSYEDVNISKTMFGIEKATDTVNYDYLYQYDEFYPFGQITAKQSNVMICNVFDKKTSGTEYITQVSLFAPETYTCKVYVNPNGTSKAQDDLQLVTLKAGESETISQGYHTLEFSKPIEIKSNSFAVAIEIQGTKSTVKVALESKVSELKELDSVVNETGKCFITTDKNEWIDLGNLKSIDSSSNNADSTIKAFTTTELLDNSLNKIEIVTPPTKTSYFAGENFDKTGMVVQAKYNRKDNSIVTLDSSSYNITNGTDLKAGQTSVTITYEDKTAKQEISVEENSVTELKIKIPPTKTQYKEGQNFDKTGMIIEATYKNGTKKEIADYTITNGNNLKANQAQITISYGGKTIEQNINVIPNPLIKIEVTKKPDKIKYIVGQDFDKTGMVVTGTYQDGTKQEITDYTIEDGTKLKKEQKNVNIKYDGKAVSQEITVEEKAIIEISISKMPTKTKYIQSKEELNLEGGLLKVKYNDNTEEEIKLTSEQIKLDGFDNSKIGKNVITVTYKEKQTTFEIEILEEQLPKNSDFDKANCIINGSKYYTFTDKSKQEYFIIDVTVKDIIRNNENDSYEYYYYISSNKDEDNIEKWVKITDKQIVDNKLSFIIDTKNIEDYGKLSDSNNIYLYIKEVVIKGGNQSVIVSKPMEMEQDGDLEIYLDNVKVKNTNKNDGTEAKDKLPNTGIINIIIIALVLTGVGTLIYIRYKKLSKYVK